MYDFYIKDLLKIMSKHKMKDPTINKILEAWGSIDGDMANNLLDLITDNPEVSKYVNIDLKVKSTGISLDCTLLEKMLDKYPLLRYIKHHDFTKTEFEDHIIDYLNH